ncbi:hypothetical protein HMPREF1619_04362 [Klebsiella pneumoniae 909957]|nr:hypothetical protein HMPREF9538_00027 [Klebsiella sp. MS 92-3]ESA98988.1 hypothetical protein HMPREF1619_04362 [Klebsiella pneumoniae 909957]
MANLKGIARHVNRVTSWRRHFGLHPADTKLKMRRIYHLSNQDAMT